MIYSFDKKAQINGRFIYRTSMTNYTKKDMKESDYYIISSVVEIMENCVLGENKNMWSEFQAKLGIEGLKL